MIGLSRLHSPRVVQLCAIFAVAVAGAGVLGWRAGEMPPAAAGTMPPGAWALPPVDTRDPARDAAALMARHPFGGNDAFRDIDSPRPAAAATAPWHLAGVIERGGERMALVLVGQGATAKLEYRGIGDSLPDGSVLMQIDADSATSRQGQSAAAEQRVYRLFEKAH